MDSFNVTEDELRLELARLGYHNVSQDAIRQMQQDIEKLAEHERSKNSSISTNSSYAQRDVGNPRPTSRQFEENQQQTRVHLNTSSMEHSIYGKENYQSSVKFAAPEKRQYHTVYVPSIDVLDEDNSLLSENDRFIGPTGQSHRIESVPAEVDNDLTLDTCSQTSERRVIKRKVLRKKGGESRVCDESITTESDELEELSDIRERLRQLPLTERTDSKNRQKDEDRRPYSAPCYRLPENFDGPKALIKPMSGNPHTRNLKRSDPVSRYQSYEQCWQTHRAPGEKAHKGLRWNIREQMLYHDHVVEKKPQKVFQPNTYVVPTEKKRKALRWQVRHDMAQGIVPPSAYEY